MRLLCVSYPVRTLQLSVYQFARKSSMRSATLGSCCPLYAQGPTLAHLLHLTLPTPVQAARSPRRRKVHSWIGLRLRAAHQRQRLMAAPLLTMLLRQVRLQLQDPQVYHGTFFRSQWWSPHTTRSICPYSAEHHTHGWRSRFIRAATTPYV